jgi:CRP/FNR family transcriptional regulator
MEKYLMELPFWKDLDQDQKEAIAICATIKRYRQGELIYSKDQECLGMIKILSGSVRAFMLSEEGREIVLYRIQPGETDVLSAACVVDQIRFETQMTAETDCEILIIPALCLAVLKGKNLALRCFILEKLGERFSDVMLLMENMLFSPLNKRIAKVLLEQLKETDSKTLFMTHAQLASDLNSSREVISRILKEMEKNDIITLGRGKITVKNLPSLEELAI